MEKLFKVFLSHRYLPSWMILFCDLSIYAISFILAYWLSENLSDRTYDNHRIILQLLTGVPIFYLAAHLLHPHRGIIRHSTTKDASIIILFHSVITFGLFLVSLFGHESIKEMAIPYSIIFIHYYISVLLMITFRLIVKFTFAYFSILPGVLNQVLIYGAGNKGQITREVIEKNRSLRIKLVGFIDDNWQLQNKMVAGLPVYSEEKAFKMIIDSAGINEIIIAINRDKITEERKRQIINLCLEKQIKIRDVPETSKWINGSLSIEQIKEVQIEDLLGREPIVLNKDRILKGLYNQTILVTGAAGSIGSELVRQILNFQPRQLILVDQAESALFNLQTEIKNNINCADIVYIVGNVTDKYRMQKIFSTYRPEIVFHAAAYKHVPLMELQPYEVIKCNIGGIKVIADLAVKFFVKKFVMISTDKAVNPTNVMGATKRICEIYIQSLSQLESIKTHFITTRFGNVLGSNGSVIPIFKKQIKDGGPITVTHRDVTRYFMTIPEASQLVLEAGFMGSGGEIFLFDMGQPVKIYDLAEKMILLSGLTPNKDIRIEITGLRPGEKLYEELLASSEENLPVINNKILIGKIRPFDYYEQNQKITDLLDNLSKENDELLVARLKNLVPEFISKNSAFEIIDKSDKQFKFNPIKLKLNREINDSLSGQIISKLAT